MSRGRCGCEIARLRRGRCELPAILRLSYPPKSLAASGLFCGRRRKHFCDFCSGMVASRARLRPPWSLRFCDTIFVMAKLSSESGMQKSMGHELPKSSMEDWDADLSPCNFATTHFFYRTHFSAERKEFYVPVTSRPPI